MSSGIGSVPSDRSEASPTQHPSKALHNNRGSVDIDHQEDEPDLDGHPFPGCYHRLFSIATRAGRDGQ